MLNVFQEGELLAGIIEKLNPSGRSHMAIVSRRPRRREADVEDAESVMTAAAGGLRQRFMRKVAGITHGDRSSSSDESSPDDKDVEKGQQLKRKKSRKTRRKKDKGEGDKGKGEHDSSGSSSGSPAKPAQEIKEAKGDKEAQTKKSQAEEVKDQVEAEKKKRTFADAAKLTQLEQTVPADAQLPPEMVEKVSFLLLAWIKLIPSSSSRGSRVHRWVSSHSKMCWRS